MRKIIVSLFAFLCIAMVTNAQNSKLVGSWLAVSAEVKGQIEEPFFVTQFTKEGKMIIMGMEFGSWELNKSNSAFTMESEFDKDFNGEAKVLKLTETEFAFIKDGAKINYIKLNETEIAADNGKSNLEGLWIIENPENPSVLYSLKIELPDSFVLVEKGDGMSSTSKGTWIFNPKENSIIMMGLSHFLKGKHDLNLPAADKIVFHQKGNVINGLKEKPSTIKVERLEFTESDFFDENGDYKYDDEEQKIPWQDPLDMSMRLVNIDQLFYKYSTLIEGTGSFDSEILIANVNADPQEYALSIDYIFHGYDNYNLPEDTQLPPNNEFSKPLFPEKEGDFRIVKTEQITTPAGTFDCTVIEAVYSFDVRKRLWMINDKPGIYAKIIEDKAGGFGHYSVYELQEIKEKE